MIGWPARAGAVVGVLAVGGLLFYLRFRRQRAIREQLPDVMELMARAVRAGESLDQAIALAGNSGIPARGRRVSLLRQSNENGVVSGGCHPGPGGPRALGRNADPGDDPDRATAAGRQPAHHLGTVGTESSATAATSTGSSGLPPRWDAAARS